MVEIGDWIKAHELVVSDNGESRYVHAGIYKVIEVEKDLQGIKYWVEAEQPTFFYDFETELLDNAGDIEYTTEVGK